jgi:hypothetical protein
MTHFASSLRVVGHFAALVFLVMLALIGFPAASGSPMDGVAHAASSNRVDVSRVLAAPMVARRVSTARPDGVRRLATTAGGTIQFGVPTTFTVSTGGETAWMTFSGSAGMRVSMTTSMSGTWTAKILDATTGQIVGSCSTNCNGGSNFIDATPLPSTPDVTLYKVQLTASAAGNGTITLYNVPNDLSVSTTPLAGNGAAVPISIVTPGQKAVITFQGRQGERLSWAHSDATSLYNTTLRDQNNPNTILVSCGTYCNGGSAFLEPFALPADGTYQVVFDPSYSWTGSKTVTLYDVPDDLTLSTTPVSGSGAAVPISISTPGQNAVITFQGRQGERLSWTHSDATSVYSTTLRNANNAVLVSCGYSCNGGSAFLEPFPLPAAGTYKVVFDPGYTWKGSKTIKLYDVPDDLGVSLTPTSAATSVSLPIDTPGRNAQITFQGYAGQTLSWTQASTIPVYATRLYKDASLISSCGYACNGYTGTLNPLSLPADGTYRVVFDPSYSYTGSNTITLKLTPGGSAAIAGFANVGEQLTASSSFSTPPANSLGYQWQRCNAQGASCADIFGATGAMYTVADADVGSRLRVKATGTNSYGSTTLISRPTSPILPALSALMLSYRPHLYYDSQETWRPLEINQFLGEGQRVCVGDPNNPDPVNDPCAISTDTSTLMSLNVVGAYLDIGDIGESNADQYKTPNTACWTSNGYVVLRDCDIGPASAIYMNPGEDTADYEYLDYWTFLRNNDVTGLGTLDDHEGDWEGVTVVLDATTNAQSPSISAVLFASHNVLTWYLPSSLLFDSVTHVNVFPARGTHASYPDTCTDNCSTPPGSDWPYEAPHDGLSAWGNNDDGVCGGACVKLFGSWASWLGRWGSSAGITSSVGWSPQSPGNQTRYTCAASGYGGGCTRLPGSRTPQSAHRSLATGASPRDIRQCAAWAGGSVAVLACDPQLLRQSILHHRLRHAGALRLRVAGHRSGNAPGLAQVVGEPLRDGDKIVFSGRGTLRTIVIVEVVVGPHLYQAIVSYQSLKESLTASTQFTMRIVVQQRKPQLYIGNRRLAARVKRLR